jgi:hypothetical protein
VILRLTVVLRQRESIAPAPARQSEAAVVEAGGVANRL